MNPKPTGFSLRRYSAIVRKEIIQLLRDKISTRVPLVMPVMLMLLFGYAVNIEVSNVRTAVFDQSQTRESRAFIDQFRASGYFRIYQYVNSEQELENLIDQGVVKAGISIPPTYAQDVRFGRTPQTLLLIDGSDSTVAQTVLNSGVLIAQYNAIQEMQNKLKRSGLGAVNIEQFTMNTRVMYNPNMDIHYFTIPGLVGLIMMNLTLMLTAFAMVRERERGTIETLIVTPVKPSELILGKLTPYVVIGFLGFVLAMLTSRFWFNIPIQGNVWLLLIPALIFIISCLAVGMLISTAAKNQLQAMMLVIITILPSIILTGFMFPIDAMPQALQYLTFFLPLTYFLRIIRGIVSKGVGITAVWKDLLCLTVFMVVALTISIKRFKKALD